MGISGANSFLSPAGVKGSTTSNKLRMHLRRISLQNLKHKFSHEKKCLSEHHSPSLLIRLLCYWKAKDVPSDCAAQQEQRYTTAGKRAHDFSCARTPNSRDYTFSCASNPNPNSRANSFSSTLNPSPNTLKPCHLKGSFTGTRRLSIARIQPSLIPVCVLSVFQVSQLCLLTKKLIKKVDIV